MACCIVCKKELSGEEISACDMANTMGLYCRIHLAYLMRDPPESLEVIKTLREGYKRLAKTYAGGDIESFCLQILDHTKEYEDRAIIQQQLQPDSDQ